MAGIRLKHVERHKDRHGKIRFYFRRGKGRRIPLHGIPGSQDFMASYTAALSSSTVNPRTGRALTGSFDALAIEYFQSPDFLRLKESTQIMTRNIVERFCAEHGHRSVSGMRRADILRMMGQRSTTPAAANNLLKRLRVLVGFAIDLGWITDDPTIRVKRFREGEHHTWTEAEIEQFEAAWPIGTRERTAFALHLYTGQRRADVCRMTWADIEAGKIRVIQAKTGARLTIPLHAELSKALAAWPKVHMTIITNSNGSQYAVASYGNWMADTIDRAGLESRCVLHGIRKAAARRLAEAGCTPHQIAAITGHKTLGEIERYTRAAEQEGLAGAAILGLGRHGKHKEIQ